MIIFLGENGIDEERASLIIQISDFESIESDFIKFKLELNEVPINHFETGKDVIIDWELLDDFNSDNILYVDANSLEMQQKTLYERKEFKLETNNLIASNFYPIT